MLKQSIAVASICATLFGTSVGEEVTFEVVGTFDRVVSGFTDELVEGDGYTLTVRYDDAVLPTETEGDFFSQLEYPGILGASLSTSRGLETSITTGANSELVLNTQETADSLSVKLSDFDLSLESNNPELEFAEFQLDMNFLMPSGTLGSLALSDLPPILESDVLLSTSFLGIDSFQAVRFGDFGNGGLLSALSFVESISVRIVPEPDSLTCFACLAVVLLLRRR